MVRCLPRLLSRLAGGSLLLVLLVAASGRVAADETSLRIGSKRFTESYVLGELLRLQVGHAEHRAGLGNTAILVAALESGAIDVYPEYSGTIAREILGREDLDSLDGLAAPLAARGLAASVPLGFEDAYALAMPQSLAARLGIRDLADLARHPELRLGFSQEFLHRKDGWPAIVAHYDLHLPAPQGLDHGLAYRAVAQGAIDVIDAYTTDAQLDSAGMMLLADPRHAIPSYQAVLLYRVDVPRRWPAAWASLTALQGRIDLPTMRAANARVDLEHRSFAEAARALHQQLAGAAPTPLANRPAPAEPLLQRFWRALIAPDLLPLILQHLALVAGPVIVATLLGVPLGLLAAYRPGLGGPLLALVGVLQTIPALALLALLIALTGRIGMLPALIALLLYALLPILSATQVAIENLDSSLREAAVALGAPWRARVWAIELPAARPAILAGIRTAAVINVGGATLAAFVGAGGLGERIVSGLAVNDAALLLAGAVPTALLALLIEGGFRWLGRRR